MHAASLSDRRDARRSLVALAADPSGVSGVTLDGRRTQLTGPIERAIWLPWQALPRQLGVVQSAGVVLLAESDGRTHVFPIDPWWMEPAPAHATETVLVSSGFAELVSRLGVELEVSGNTPPSTLWNAVRLHEPVDRAHLRRERAVARAVLLLMAVALFGGGVFLLLFGHRVFTIEEGPRVLGWVCGVTSAIATLNTVRSLLGRVRMRPRGDRPAIDPQSGSPWFRRTAAIRRTDAGGLDVIDGQGVVSRFDTTASSSSRSAVVRARIVGRAATGRLLLVDGVDVIRAEIPFDAWARDAGGVQALGAFLVDCGLVVETVADRRRTAALTVDEFRSAGAPGASLFTAATPLRTAPVTPLVAVLVVQLVVAVFARVGGIVPGALAVAAFVASCAALAAAVGVELGARLPRGARGGAVGSPLRSALTVGWTVVAIGVGVGVGIVHGAAGPIAYGLLVCAAGPLSAWLRYRTRALGRRESVRGFPAWLRHGAPR